MTFYLWQLLARWSARIFRASNQQLLDSLGAVKTHVQARPLEQGRHDVTD